MLGGDPLRLWSGQSTNMQCSWGTALSGLRKRLVSTFQNPNTQHFQNSARVPSESSNETKARVRAQLARWNLYAHTWNALTAQPTVSYTHLRAHETSAHL
eukprot:8348719-Alexandrium_andersonii.AAC.1